MDWDEEPSVVLSAGPVRVDVEDPDPDWVPRPVGFVLADRESPETAEAMAQPAGLSSGLAAAADFERQMAKVAEVVGSSAANLERLRDAARPTICEQDPDVWGDQA